MSKPLLEQNEWIREKLTRLWGENQADYFVNPSRSMQKTAELSKDELAKSQPSLTQKLKGRSGLYAYTIWENMRDDSQYRLKPFELDKELQVHI